MWAVMTPFLPLLMPASISVAHAIAWDFVWNDALCRTPLFMTSARHLSPRFRYVAIAPPFAWFWRDSGVNDNSDLGWFGAIWCDWQNEKNPTNLDSMGLCADFAGVAWGVQNVVVVPETGAIKLMKINWLNTNWRDFGVICKNRLTVYVLRWLSEL